MKIKLTITIVLGWLIWWAVGGVWTLSASNNFLWTDNLRILSQDDFYSDLDCRDEFNWPRNSFLAKENLRHIFLSGLAERLTQQELYTISLAFSQIRKTIPQGPNLFRFAFRIIEKIVAVAITGLKTQTKMLVKLTRWLLPLLIFNFLALTHLLIVAPTKSPPLVLRC